MDQSEVYVPRPGDVIEIRPDADYWRLGYDDQQPEAWERTFPYQTGDHVRLMWTGVQGADPFDQFPVGKRLAMERYVDGQVEEFRLLRDESGEVRVEPLVPDPYPPGLSGAEPFRLRAGDRVTNDLGSFAFHGWDTAGAERWMTEFEGGVQTDAPNAPFRAGEPATVVRRSGDDRLEFTVTKADDGLVLVPGVEQPAFDLSKGGGPTRTDRDIAVQERSYEARTRSAAARLPSAHSRLDGPSGSR
ncbi:hypothetical protein [Kribbella sp. NPDC004875]|uniref:hypothetical protein n=1 Tax=Kribbella sp. NPDC004875 TaxID=3364107 RepID=UPI003688A8F1